MSDETQQGIRWVVDGDTVRLYVDREQPEALATASDLIAALQANDAARAEVLNELLELPEAQQAHVDMTCKLIAAEARILEYKSSEGHMREELRAAEAKAAELTQERDDYRDGALTEERRCDELLDERNLARNETLAALEKVEELRAAYIASESRHATETSARFAAEQKVKELESELAFAGWHNLNEELLRRRNELYDDAALAEAKPPEPPIQPPPVPQVAEAMEAMEARRCGNAWHTDCDLRWTHCFPLNPESAPAQGGREKVAGTPLTVEMMVGALRAGQLAWAKDDNVWDVIADELERAAKEESDG